jgi:hypothetical protein
MSFAEKNQKFRMLLERIEGYYHDVAEEGDLEDIRAIHDELYAAHFHYYRFLRIYRSAVRRDMEEERDVYRKTELIRSEGALGEDIAKQVKHLDSMVREALKMADKPGKPGE